MSAAPRPAPERGHPAVRLCQYLHSRARYEEISRPSRRHSRRALLRHGLRRAVLARLPRNGLHRGARPAKKFQGGPHVTPKEGMLGGFRGSPKPGRPRRSSCRIRRPAVQGVLLDVRARGRRG